MIRAPTKVVDRPYAGGKGNIPAGLLVEVVSATEVLREAKPLENEIKDVIAKGRPSAHICNSADAPEVELVGEAA